MALADAKGRVAALRCRVSRPGLPAREGRVGPKAAFHELGLTDVDEMFRWGAHPEFVRPRTYDRPILPQAARRAVSGAHGDERTFWRVRASSERRISTPARDPSVQPDRTGVCTARGYGQE